MSIPPALRLVDTIDVDATPALVRQDTPVPVFVYPSPGGTPAAPSSPSSDAEAMADVVAPGSGGSSRPRRGDPATSPKPVKKSTGGTRATAWMFTAYGDISEERIKEVYDGPSVVFLAGQLEMCPDTERLHFQGYLIVQPRQSMAQVKALFKELKPHLEPRNGSHQQAMDYVNKVDTRPDGDGYYSLHLGDEKWAAQSRGQRSDLAKVLADINTHDEDCNCFHCYLGGASCKLYFASPFWTSASTACYDVCRLLKAQSAYCDALGL